jgi:hypothetical protein
MLTFMAMNKQPSSDKREYDHADIDDQPVETGGTGSNAFPLPKATGQQRAEEKHPSTEDDQDVDVPVDHSHYGEDVERDSDA